MRHYFTQDGQGDPQMVGPAVKFTLALSINESPTPGTRGCCDRGDCATIQAWLRHSSSGPRLSS